MNKITVVARNTDASSQLASTREVMVSLPLVGVESFARFDPRPESAPDARVSLLDKAIPRYKMKLSELKQIIREELE